ncbi:MAG: hypothetical protein ACE5IG_04160 [Dehalococcoidia bacterium]
MEAVFLLVLPVVLWAHAWYLLGFYTSPKTLGLLGAGVAITLLALVVLGPLRLETDATLAAVSGLILLWAAYAAIVGANGLWGFDERTLGFYSLFLWVASLAYVLYFFVGDLTDVGVISTMMGVAALVLSVLAALLFFHQGPPYPRLRAATGWFFLIGSIIVAVIGVGALIGAVDLTV